MNIISGDILNHNAGLWIEQSYLMRNIDVDNGYLRVAKSRAKNNASERATWKYETIQGKCYFSYGNLPAQYRVQLPDPDTLQKFAIRLTNDAENLVRAAQMDGYKLFLSTYANYPMNKAQIIAQSAAIVHAAKNYCDIKEISYYKSAFFEQLIQEITLQNIKYLPRTWRNLRDKIEAYANGTPITALVNPKNEKNSAAAQFINNDFIKGLAVELAGSQQNYSAAYIYRKIRLICIQSGIDEYPSLRWVSDFVQKPATQYLISGRYGSGSRLNHKYRAYTPTQTALYAGDCWQIDGTRVNIIDHKATWIDKTGKKRTGQKFLYIVCVRDVMSGLPLGWEYCYEESAQAIINAIAMAVRNAGYLPYEFIYDRFPGHNSEDWAWVEWNMQRLGVAMTVTHKAEGKANIERWFGTLQSVFMIESDLFYGEGVKSTRRHAHRSRDYVVAMRQWALKNSFNFDDACRETNKIIENYIQRPYSAYSRKYAAITQSPFELHEESDKPNVYPVAEHHFCYLFGLKKQVSIRNYMIQTDIEKATYYYGIDDCGLVEKYTGVKLFNCFDYEDLSRVHLFDGEIYLGTFDEVKPAQRFGPNKTMGAVGTIKSIARRNDENRRAKLAEIAAKKEAATPEPDDEPDAVSAEIGILQSGKIKKRYYEEAETAYLREQWRVDDEEDILISVKNQY
jgi:hypothetical protein